jgi:hypothetical protein
MAVETAVLDACVLFRGAVRDFLLRVAEAGAFSPFWSDIIHAEWMRNRQLRFGDPVSRLEYARAEMERAFPGANIAPDQEVLAGISLPDPHDAHVIATAVAAQAVTIVTYNEAHFPAAALASLGLRQEIPDVFCMRLFRQDRAGIIEGARRHRESLKRPSFDADSYLDHLRSHLELRRTAELLRTVRNQI